MCAFKYVFCVHAPVRTIILNVFSRVSIACVACMHAPMYACTHVCMYATNISVQVCMFVYMHLYVSSYYMFP